MARPQPENPDQKPRDTNIEEEDRDPQQSPNEEQRQERNPKRDDGQRQKQQREPIEPSENDGEGDSPGGPSSPGTRKPR